MNSKKISTLLCISLLTLVVMGCVSALNITGYSGGADPERGIRIEGIEFNIPEGYEKNDAKTVVNQTNGSGEYSFVYNQETYENSAGEEIIICIMEFDNYDVDADLLHRICEGTDEKIMRGYSGYINPMGNFTQFAYAFDNKAVSITAPDEDTIKQVLVVEDA